MVKSGQGKRPVKNPKHKPPNDENKENKKLREGGGGNSTKNKGNKKEKVRSTGSMHPREGMPDSFTRPLVEFHALLFDFQRTDALNLKVANLDHYEGDPAAFLSPPPAEKGSTKGGGGGRMSTPAAKVIAGGA